MKVRGDLESVSAHITKLLNIGNAFIEHNKQWGYLKHKEDFQSIYEMPRPDLGKVELVYSGGKSIALYMADALSSINHDSNRYPTLTTIIEEFKDTCVYGSYNPKIPDSSEKICEKYNIRLFSIEQMVIKFKQQEKLLSAVRITLNMLKDSDLYKSENGLEIMNKNQTNITITGNNSSSIIVDSDGATATTNMTQSYNEPTVFLDIIKAIKKEELDPETEKMLIDNTENLASSYKNGSFTETYKDFMQNISAHITVFTPFIPLLTSFI